jgi:hypothetical protein
LTIGDAPAASSAFTIPLQPVTAAAVSALPFHGSRALTSAPFSIK